MNNSKIAQATMLLSALLTESCTNPRENTAELQQLSEIDYTVIEKKEPVSSIVDTVEFIPLYGSVERPISHVDELQVNENGIFILDRRRHRMHAYSGDGHQKYIISAVGHAQNEYLEIACAAVTDTSVFIADNFSKKINEYSAVTGVYKNSYPASIVVGGIRPLKNGNFLLAELPLEGANQLEASDGNRLYIADKSFHVVSSFCPYGRHRDKIGMIRYLSDNDSTIIYCSMGYNGFTKLSAVDGEAVGQIPIITERPYDGELISDMPVSEAMDFAEECGWQFLTSPPVVAGRYICLSVKDGDVAEPMLYDMVTGQSYINGGADMYNNLMAPDDAYCESFYSVYNFGSEFLDGQLEMGFNRPSHTIDSIIRNDGTVILRYKMKN